MIPSPAAPLATPAASRPALVVFVDQGAGPWLRPLKQGYRHCFVALRQEPRLWLICDPLKDRIEITAAEVERVALAETYRAAGHRVWSGTTFPGPARPRARVPGPLTCVAVVKRLIGVSAPWVVTPFQLHRHLLSATEASPGDVYRNKYLTTG